MRVVPWASWSEWNEVRGALLEEEQSGGGERLSAAQALHRCSLWRLRGRVPLSVDVTAALVEARLLDGASSARLSDLSLRSLYALALVRLVNGVTDPQQKGRKAAPVASLAAQSGLAPLLVDVRHATAHNQLPSLPCLRHAAALALAWCADRYWAPQQRLLQEKRAEAAAALSALATHCSLVVSQRRGSRGAAAAAADEGDAEEEDEDGEEEEEAGAAAAQPSASLKRRKLGAALRTLSRLVPPTCADLLCTCLLEERGLMLLSCGVEGGGGGAAPREGPLALPLHAWAEALRALARRWPTLPWLLLSSATRRLVSATASPAAATPSAPLFSTLIQELLLPLHQPSLTEQQRRVLRLALLSTPAVNAEGQGAVSVAAEAVARCGAVAEAAPVPEEETGGAKSALEQAEEEMRRFKRRRAGEGGQGEAAAGAGSGWKRLTEWEPLPIGAPPPWTLALDGAPRLEEGEVRVAQPVEAMELAV